MTCEELGQTAMMQPNAAESGNLGWTEARRRRRATPPPAASPRRVVVSGMLPTLRALAGLSREGPAARGAVCLVPLEGSADAASHLQATLLEAYCREVGLRLLRLPERALREAFGGEHEDLGCLLVLGDQPFRLEAPA